MRAVIALILVLHALIHIMGVAKAFQWAEISALQPISKPMGVLWLMAFLLLSITTILYLTQVSFWWMVGLAAILLSQCLLIPQWTEAKWGTIANLVILIPVLIAFVGNLPSSFKSQFNKEVKEGLSRSTPMPLLSENDIQHLPDPVQKYLHYTGSIGKPQVQNFKILFEGYMKTKVEGDWSPIKAWQYTFWDQRTRAFYIESTMMGVPFDGFHLYKGPNATMQIRVASLFQVVDAKGSKMNKSETVTMFNDICLMAPSLLVDKDIQWKELDALTVEATFTNQGNTISSLLYFNKEGALINFVSKDRYLSEDGKTYLNYPWSTPVSKYKEFVDGRKLNSYGEAIWHMPEGDFTYAKFDLKEVRYNVDSSERVLE